LMFGDFRFLSMLANPWIGFAPDPKLIFIIDTGKYRRSETVPY